MSYTLAVLGKLKPRVLTKVWSDTLLIGCGTMGIAILSGVLTSLETRSSLPNGHNHSSTEPSSGISTPTKSQFLDAPDDALPSRFIATVGREETGRKLRRIFEAMGGLGDSVDVIAGEANVRAVKEADVVLVW